MIAAIRVGHGEFLERLGFWLNPAALGRHERPPIAARCVER